MDTSNPTALLKALLPKLPMIGKTVAFHALGLSNTSSQWDLRTELTVKVIRSFVNTPHPQSISKSQHISIKDPGIKGRIWISKVVVPKPQEDGVRDALFKAIEALGPGELAVPEITPFTAEWTAYRADVAKDAPELKISEEEKYVKMMEEVKSDVTVLYLHGGAYYLLDPASHRMTCQKLAKVTKGRCLSVRYRLAPQNPFPAALLDALIAYMTLIYPPPGSIHAPVKPEHIVISGDSAGGNLSIVLLQTILELRHQNRNITWNGTERSVPLPAGVALNSGWFDVTHSMPSCELNAKYDYLPSPSSHPPGGPKFPKCDIWPSTPPRKAIYVVDSHLLHPLVSPVTAESWEGSCPLWIETGEELLTDENLYVARKAASQGVPVVFEQYMAMPHCFAMVLEGHPGSRRCFDGWAKFISDVVERPEAVKTSGVKIEAKTLRETPIDVLGLSTLTHEEVIERMKESISKMSNKPEAAPAKL